MAKIIGYGHVTRTKANGDTYVQQHIEIVQSPVAANEKGRIFFKNEADVLERGVLYEADVLFRTDYKTGETKFYFANYRKVA